MICYDEWLFCQLNGNSDLKSGENSLLRFFPVRNSLNLESEQANRYIICFSKTSVLGRKNGTIGC